MAKTYKPEVHSEYETYWGEESVHHSARMVYDKQGKYVTLDSHLSTVNTLIRVQNKNRKFKEEIERLKEEIKRLK